MREIMRETKTQPKIKIEKPTEKQLSDLGVQSWPIWTKEPSTFDWHYDEQEMCYFLEGDVTVKTPNEAIRLGKGDLVTFPQGLSCTWMISRAVKKHYRFGG